MKIMKALEKLIFTQTSFLRLCFSYFFIFRKERYDEHRLFDY